MHLSYKDFHIGLRTVKTAVAVIIAMAIVTYYGVTTSKLIFAMLGAMAAMEPSLKESLEACLTQIAGVFFGALTGVVLLALPLPTLVVIGIGIVLVITLYNAFHIRFSPTLPCLIVVILCTTPDIQPLSYAVGRFWDTAIGLGVGLVINALVFPYDNSQQIRGTVECLDKELICFLEDMFDGDNILPDTEKMVRTIDAMERQLKIFSKQWLLLYLPQNRQKLEAFWVCEGKARQLVAQMEVLCRMEYTGRLNEENRKRLTDCGANIQDQRMIDDIQEADIVTNYHVAQLLTLRQDLMAALKRNVFTGKK